LRLNNLLLVTDRIRVANFCVQVANQEHKLHENKHEPAWLDKHL